MRSAFRSTCGRRAGGVVSTFRVILGCALVVVQAASAQTVYDVSDDWSDSLNPNGVWTYTGNGLVPLTTSVSNWGAFGITNAWAASTFPSPGHVPMWFKGGLTAGVGMHGSEGFTNAWVGLIWTSPADGTVDIAGSVRQLLTVTNDGFGGNHFIRNSDWRLRLNASPLAAGNISGAEPFDSLESGAGGSLSGIDVSVGDQIILEFISPTSFATFNGVDLTVTLSERPLLSLEASRERVWANGRETVELTAMLVDQEGEPVAGRNIEISEDSAGNVTYADISNVATTDENGVARFVASSIELGQVTFTVVDTLNDGVTATAVSEFVKRRVPIFVQGINTSYSFGDQIWPELRAALANSGFSWATVGTEPEQGSQCENALDDDFDGVIDDGCPSVLHYSYNGGSAFLDGIWLASTYLTFTTSQNLRSSMQQLWDLMDQYSGANPNTSFAVIGHSQGGLLAFSALAISDRPGIEVGTVVTLDGALGGSRDAKVAALLTDWGTPASRQMEGIYRTASDHDRQGTTARAINGVRNDLLLEMGRLNGVRTATIGNTVDCVWNPGFCVEGIDRDNSSTQIVEGADQAILLTLDLACRTEQEWLWTTFGIIGEILELASCVEALHSEVLTNGLTLNFVPSFIGQPLSAE